MIRFKHLSGSLQGRTAELAKPVLRIGRAPDCEVRFDQAQRVVARRGIQVRIDYQGGAPISSV